MIKTFDISNIMNSRILLITLLSKNVLYIIY